MEMFCNQCEQTANGKACTVSGVCGKKPDVAALQDLLVYQLRAIAYYANKAIKYGISDKAINRFTAEALFSTVTNVNFDPQRIEAWIGHAEIVKGQARNLWYETAGLKAVAAEEANIPSAVSFKIPDSKEKLISKAHTIDIINKNIDEDCRSLLQLLLYGCKGMAAYIDHAMLLGKNDDTVFAFLYEALDYLNIEQPSFEQLLRLCLRCGEVNIRAMELLDFAHTERFGHPQPTSVSTGRKAGPAIVVSGHDLLDLEMLLEQTQGQGVWVYTHGEMLPAHGYPALKKYSHLAGHFGTAWQNQQMEFDNQPCCFLFTTNCIQKPRPSYADRIFTTGLVAWPNVKHIANRDFSEVIEKAKQLGGFQATDGQSIMTGFGRNSVLSLADKIVNGVKNGSIRHFFVVGGCDGAKPGRNYYTEFVEKTPADTVILTLACGKFRFNYLALGTIGQIPRLLDIGQCNDAYSAIQIATALANAFNCNVNQLPLSIILSWYEQKAVAVLLSLLSIGVKGIRIGPTFPAFLSPNVLHYLAEKFELKLIENAQSDLESILSKKN